MKHHASLASLVLFLCAACGGGGPDANGSETQGQLDPFGLWVWTVTTPFGCPTVVEQDFPFLDMDNKQFNVFSTGKDGIGANFIDSAGNAVEMTGTFNSVTGFVDATFCITEAQQTILQGDNGGPICPDAKGYISDQDGELVKVFDLDTGNSLGYVQQNGEDFDFLEPRDMGVSPDGRYLLVPDNDDDSVSVVETATDNVVQTMNTDDFFGPTSAAFHPSLPFAYVLNEAPGKGTTFVRIIDTSSFPFTPLGVINFIAARPTGLCLNHAGTLMIALHTNGTMAVCRIASNGALTTIDSTAPTINEANQCAFTPNDSELLVVGSGGVAIYDTSVFDTEKIFFDGFKFPGWDVAVTPDGTRAYITTGEESVVAQTGVPAVGCLDLATREFVNGVSLPSAFGIDTCEGYAFVAESSRGAAFSTPAHDVWELDTVEEGTYVRIVRQPVFEPRVVKIRFTAFLTLLDNQRQLDGRSVITQTINFTFACQTVVNDNTWVFVQTAPD